MHHIIPSSLKAVQLLHRDGSSWSYPSLDALTRVILSNDLIGGIVEQFSTWTDEYTGKTRLSGEFKVYDAFGNVVSLDVITKAYWTEIRKNRKKRNTASKRKRKFPRRSPVTKSDNRFAEWDRLDLKEIDPRWIRLVPKSEQLSDPYEDRPYRHLERCWKAHRATQYR